MKINLLIFTRDSSHFYCSSNIPEVLFPWYNFFFTSFSLETSLLLLELECWQQNNILLHLENIFISFHTWRIFSLNIEFWIFSCFLVFLDMVHGFWDEKSFHSNCSLYDFSTLVLWTGYFLVVESYPCSS